MASEQALREEITRLRAEVERLRKYQLKGGGDVGRLKEVPWFRHDMNARNDERMQALATEYGMEGIGRFWCLVEILREQSDYRLPLTKWTAGNLAKVWNTEKQPCSSSNAQAFLDALVEHFQLLKRDRDHVWSESLLRRMDSWEMACSKRRETAQKGARARWEQSLSIAQAKPEQCFSTKNGTEGVDLTGVEGVEGGEETKAPPSSPSAPQDEPQEKTGVAQSSTKLDTLVSRLQAVDKSLLIGITHRAQLDQLLAAVDADTIVAVWEFSQARKPKALRFFLEDFSQLRAAWEKEKRHGPIAADAGPKFAELMAQRDGADPAEVRASILGAARMKREKRMPLSELDAAYLRQADGEELTARDCELLGLPLPPVVDTFEDAAKPEEDEVSF